MRHRILAHTVLCLAVFICVVVSPTRAADKKAEEGRVNGTVHMFNKNASTIVVTKGNLQWQVIYTSNTKAAGDPAFCGRTAFMAQASD